MKKFFLLFLLAISSLNVNAEEPRRIYAFLVHNSYYHTAVIKETTTSNNHSWSGFDWKDNLLLDENGEEVRFNNFLPLIAYMQNRGWTFPDLEAQMRAKSEHVFGRSMFLMYHEATEAEWLEWIERGKSKKK